MRVAVVGAGIMGASTVYHLALRGIGVHLFERAPGPAAGVTQSAFGWINTVNGDPGFQEAHQLRIKAVEEYESVLSNMPELMPAVRRGSLVWKEDPGTTAFLAARHEAYGVFELLGKKAIAAKESKLKRPPDLGIFSPNDIALDPVVLATSFVARAQRLGAALHYGEQVKCLETTGQSVTGLRTDSGRFEFDMVVLAAGRNTESLLEGMHVALGIEASPVVLLRYRSDARFVQNILSFPELEIRQTSDKEVLIVEDFTAGCEENTFSIPRMRVEDALDEYFAVSEGLEFRSGAIDFRPVFADGLPRRGFVPNVNGLYHVVGHPGVILAPLLGRLVAEELDACSHLWVLRPSLPGLNQEMAP